MAKTTQDIPRKRKHNDGSTKEVLSLVTFKGEVQIFPLQTSPEWEPQGTEHVFDIVTALV